MNDRPNSPRTETEERVAENAAPSPRVPVTRDDAAPVDPATGLPAGAHDDDRSPLDPGMQLDPARGAQKRP